MYDLKISFKYNVEKNLFESPKKYGNTVLYQIGRAYCDARTVVPRHTHLNFFEFTIVTDGKGTVITNGERVEVKSGDIYVSFVGDFHEIISSQKEPLKYDFIAMQTVNGMMREDLEYIISHFHSASERIIRNENISALVANAIAEINVDSEYSDVILESIFQQIFAYTVREFKRNTPIKYTKNAGEAEILCYQIMHYIDTHIYAMKHLDELCEVTNYNYNYLSNLFKRETGDTLVSYFRNRRLETARLLLLEDTMSVTRVASILNYSSVYIFSRAFKERYGIPPSVIAKNKEK